ncbi:hypothetical protein Tco_0499412 [Tanacetum coccineum]
MIDQHETEVIVQEETPTKIIEEHGSGEKGEMDINTASPPKVAKVSTAEAHVYTRRSAKDKGKAIMEEPATPKKVKKRTQVQLSMDEELARKMEEEERARFNAEQEARALQEEEEERLNLETTRELKRQLDQRQKNQKEVYKESYCNIKRKVHAVEKDSSKPEKEETSKQWNKRRLSEKAVKCLKESSDIKEDLIQKKLGI